MSNKLQSKTHFRTLTNNYKNYQVKLEPISNILNYVGGNSGLTEKFIYQQILSSGSKYQILSSSTENRTEFGKIPMCKINDEDLKVFEDKEGILVVRNGKAGTTVFLNKGKYTTTDHAYILFLKEDQPYQLNLKWLMYQLKSTFFEYSSSSDNGTWNMTGFFSKVTVDIPSHDEQIEVVKKYERLEELEKMLDVIHDKIKKTKNHIFSDNYKNYQVKLEPISNILTHIGGNIGLTEEKIYQTILLDGERYNVLSASINSDFILGKIPMCKINDKDLKVFEYREGIFVIRVGKAGSSRFLNKGHYAITENAYILFLKEDQPYQLNLKWLMYQLKSTFFEYSPLAEYGAWNMTGFFSKVTVDIPSHDEQIEVVKKYERLEELEKMLDVLSQKINGLLFNF